MHVYCCCSVPQSIAISLWLHVFQHIRLSCPSLSPWVYSNSSPLSQWCHPVISSSVTPFSSCSQTSGSFPVSHFFISGGQSIRASTLASVFSMNIQGWFPLGLTSLVSLLFKRLSRVFFSTTVQKHQFFGTQPCSTLTSIHDYQKNHNFDYIDLCWQSDVSTF